MERRKLDSPKGSPRQVQPQQTRGDGRTLTPTSTPRAATLPPLHGTGAWESEKLRKSCVFQPQCIQQAWEGKAGGSENHTSLGSVDKATKVTSGPRRRCWPHKFFKPPVSSLVSWGLTPLPSHFPVQGLAIWQRVSVQLTLVIVITAAIFMVTVKHRLCLVLRSPGRNVHPGKKPREGLMLQSGADEGSLEAEFPLFQGRGYLLYEGLQLIR